ncbi:hypothetical protein BST33_13300 [Mycolicibacter minnesotensis]|uniref:Uncharacterized protein n=1 Tax=Mycolicibacter minnesotensis TaxID=1118379 RepID=A0A7I7R449_9MYCO|nr:DUF1398 family protein [Mycolicibacter minnesotensis]ORA99750.1 hypothetical protein BST33_13300 [Mycolicibacter minnesotensis]BBY32926.1 DUF1398 domain-containing protein [Mycolicibacter minnesotensis]
MNSVERLAQAQHHGMRVRPETHGFPHLAEALRLAGVRLIRFDVASGGALYVMDGGVVHQPGNPLHEESVEVAEFDQHALVAAIDADKAGEITFPEFLRRCWTAGVVGYEVDTIERTCTYLGAPGGRYVEHYPAVTLARPAAPA